MKCTPDYKNRTIRNTYQTRVIVFLCALSTKPVLLYSTMNQHQCATCLELVHSSTITWQRKRHLWNQHILTVSDWLKVCIMKQITVWQLYELFNQLIHKFTSFCKFRRLHSANYYRILGSWTDSICSFSYLHYFIWWKWLDHQCCALRSIN